MQIKCNFQKYIALAKKCGEKKKLTKATAATTTTTATKRDKTEKKYEERFSPENCSPRTYKQTYSQFTNEKKNPTTTWIL